MRPQSPPGSWKAEVMSSVADSSANQEPRSYIPVVRLDMAGATVRIAGATEEMARATVSHSEMTIFGIDTIFISQI